MKIIKTAILENGNSVCRARDNYNHEWIFWLKDGEIDEPSGQDFVSDFQDYRYTHGGSEYREAVEKLQ